MTRRKSEDKAETYRRQGKLGLYVYYLVQGVTDLAQREEAIARHAADLGLTPADLAALRNDLAALDRQRAAPPAARPGRPSWLDEEATPDQLKAVKRFGYRGRMPTTKEEARRLLWRLKGAQADLNGDDPGAVKFAEDFLEGFGD
jgi:hypothetical protein